MIILNEQPAYLLQDCRWFINCVSYKRYFTSDSATVVDEFHLAKSRLRTQSANHGAAQARGCWCFDPGERLRRRGDQKLVKLHIFGIEICCTEVEAFFVRNGKTLASMGKHLSALPCRTGSVPSWLRVITWNNLTVKAPAWETGGVYTKLQTLLIAHLTINSSTIKSTSWTLEFNSIRY